jgi:hypothetical protein
MSEQSTALKFGNDMPREIIKAARKVWHQHVEAVGGPFFKPGLQLIGDLSWRADQAVMSPTTGDASSRLRPREVLIFRQPGQ